MKTAMHQTGQLRAARTRGYRRKTGGRPLCTAWLAALLLTAGLRVCAAELTVHAAYMPDYMIETGPTLEKSRGLMLEILAGAVRNARLPVRMARAAPWVRAQKEAQATPGAILPLLARTPLRENQWHWLAVAYTDKLYAYTLKGRPAYTSLDDIRLKRPRIGLKSGSAAESLTRGMGITTDVSPDMDRNFIKLISGRTEVLLLQGIEVSPVVYDLYHGAHAAMFRAGLVGVQHYPILELPLWVVTSVHTPRADELRLIDALEKFKRTAEYQSIVKKYESRANNLDALE
jgi:polar amino acid transport system substrate-binding protein